MVPPPGPHAPWSYSTSVDELTGRSTRVATLQSSNSLALSFPYAGPNYGTLVLQTNSSGFSAYVRLDKGQVTCSDCFVLVRFDDSPAEQFVGSRAKNEENRYMFISPAEKFFDRLRTSKLIRIGVPIYQAGSQVLRFENDNSPEWEPLPKRR